MKNGSTINTLKQWNQKRRPELLRLFETEMFGKAPKHPKDIRTDENNYVVDLHLERIDHPQELAQDLITTVGVVEHGLFLNMVDQVIVGDPNGPRVMDNPNK